MHSSRIIVAIILGIFVLIASVWLGVGVASDQIQTLIIAGVVLVLAICISLGQRVWLLFLFLYSMEVPFIRGLTTMEVGYAIITGFSVLAFLMRRLNLHYHLSEMDFWRFAVALMIFQAYARNPVGLNFFGASSVGGRPYLIAIMSLSAGFILSKYKVSEADLKWSRWVAIASALIMFPLNTLRYGIGRGPDIAQVQSVAGLEGEGAGRDGKYERIARTLSAILVSKKDPLKASFHPVWVWLVILVLFAAASSGYRNSVAYVGIILIIGIIYHGGMISLIISTILGVFVLGGIAMINVAYPLPGKVQRALSPFPGTWEDRYVQAGENSTEWRIEMWKAALLTEDWIQNKALGDGLGMTREEMTKMTDLTAGRRIRNYSGLTSQQESMMITGAYHSGPVQTIRTIGYFGLAVLLAAFIRMCVHTHRQIIRCWGTEWQSTMLFFGIPIIAFPFFFSIIFGTFSTAVAFFFINSALIDLFRNNLPLPAYKPMPRVEYAPGSFRNHQKKQPNP